jgi:hypothetical protein
MNKDGTLYFVVVVDTAETSVFCSSRWVLLSF